MSFLLSGEFIHETKEAILVEYKNEKYWLPKAHLEVIKNELSFDTGKYEIILKLEDWLAYKKGFSDYKPMNYHNYDDYEDDYYNGWDYLDPNG